MIAFIINSLLDSHITEEFVVSGKKQVNTLRLLIYNVRRLTSHLSVNRNCCKCIYLLPSFAIFITWAPFDNLALKSPTRIEHVGCWLLIPETISMRFSWMDSNCSWFWFGDLYVNETSKTCQETSFIIYSYFGYNTFI